MRVEQAVDNRFHEATEQFRIGQVSAVVGNKITISISGVSKTIPRLATWTPAIGNFVVVALTPAGWVALGSIA